KADARREVIWVNACEDVLADVWHIRQVEFRNHISGLNESADRRTYRVSATIHLHSRFIKRWVESHQRAAGLIRRKVQFVAQTEIEGQLPGKLPIILEKGTVVGRAQDPSVDTVSVRRVADRAEQEIIEGQESYLTAPVIIRRQISAVIDELSARANGVLTACDRENINQRSCRVVDLHIYGCTGIADSHRAGPTDTNQAQPRIGVGVSPLDTQVRVLHRVSPERVLTNKTVADTRFVDGSRA